MKYLYIILVILILMLGCSGAGGGDKAVTDCANPTSQHVELLGYYWGSSHTFGEFTQDVSEYTNFIHVNIVHGGAEDEQLVKNAIAAGLKVVIGTPGYNLAGWGAFVPRLLKYERHIAGIYAFDEPFHNQVSVKNQEMVVGIIKEDFPNTPVWVVIIDKYSSQNLPDYDYVGVTPDYGASAGEYEDYLNKLDSYLYPHQKLIIVGDAYHGERSAPLSLQEYKADQLWGYYKIAQCNPNVIGMFMFIYPTFGSKDIGTQDMPIVEDTIIDIYEEVFNNG